MQIFIEKIQRKFSINMETTIKQRLIEFIKYKELSQAKFEKRIGASNGFVNNIVRGIGADKLQSIINEFPELNTEWLLYNKGEMLRENGQNTAQNVENMSSIESFLREQLKEKDSEIKELSRRIGQLEAENRLLRERHFQDTAVSGVDSAVAG